MAVTECRIVDQQLRLDAIGDCVRRNRSEKVRNLTIFTGGVRSILAKSEVACTANTSGVAVSEGGGGDVERREVEESVDCTSDEGVAGGEGGV